MAMVSTPSIATGFVRKLYRILDNESAGIISWNAAGTSFAIHDEERLDEHVLPRYFRGRLDAFRQQLMEHGFERVRGTSAMSAMGLVNTETYEHASFLRGRPGKLSSIIRVPLPRRRRSRRKKLAKKAAAAVIEVPSTTATEPLPLGVNSSLSNSEVALAMSPAGCLQSQEQPVVNVNKNPLFTDDERFDILEWLSVAGPDGFSTRFAEGVAMASHEQAADLPSDCSIDALLELLPCVEAEMLAMDIEYTLSPTATVEHGDHNAVAGDPRQFSEDTLSSMVTWLNNST